MPIHLAITRRVRPGCEAAFERAIGEFFQRSFGPGVQGAHLLVPPPGSASREYGILRTFASEAERAAFYDSPAFRDWQQEVAPLTDGGAVQRQLHGLEAWFRTGSTAPPRWKMALVTFVAVFGVSLFLRFTLGPLLDPWPLLAAHAVSNAAVVILLTWVAMPALIPLVRPWLHASSNSST